MVAHVAPVDVPFVQPQLAAINGLEILDVVDNNTKILLLLDLENEQDFSDALKQIQDVKALQSLSYAAHYSEEAISEPSERD